MASMQIIYWRDIPTTVQIRQGRTRFTANLPERFEKAVDAAAMRDGETSTDDYLAEFKRTDPVEVEGEGDALQALADARGRTRRRIRHRAPARPDCQRWPCWLSQCTAAVTVARTFRG